MLELAEIFRHYGPAYRAKFADRMPPSHLAAMHALAQCRPETLGGHGSPCTAGGVLADSAHACTHRPGPTCHNDAATPWVDTQRARLLPVPSFLVPLT